MTTDLYELLKFVIYLPLYLATFVGIGLVLRMRRTHPRACWYAVAAGVVLFVNWLAIYAMDWASEAMRDWEQRTGTDWHYTYLAFNAVLSALQTTSAVLLTAALITGRRSAP